MPAETTESTAIDESTLGSLRKAAAAFLGSPEEIGAVGAARHLLRVSRDDVRYVVRQWPADATAIQVALAARALAAASSTSDGKLPVPCALPGDAGRWSIAIGDRLYSVATWIEGRPLARYGDFRTADGAVIDVPLPASAPAATVILDAIGVIGRFHTATTTLASESASGDTSLQRLQDRAKDAWSAQRRVVGQQAADFPEIRRWLRCGNRVLPAAAEHLQKFGATSAGTVATHSDLWPANLLTEGNNDARRLAGVVGWSRVAIGSPLVDLAQLVVHTSGWSGSAAENAIGAYTDHAMLSPGERRLLPVVAALDLVPRIGELLRLAYLDDRLIGHPGLPVLRSGLKSLLVSLETLTNVLAPEPEWNQRKTDEVRRQRQATAPRKARPTGTTPSRRSGAGRSRQGSPPRTPRKG